MVEEFEEAFASFCEVSGILLPSGSGTDALRFAIMASGVEPGDVVLKHVPNTFIATTGSHLPGRRHARSSSSIDELAPTIFLAVTLRKQSPAGYSGVFETECGRLLSLRSGRRVTALIPVHLYGQMADMDAILALADEYGLTVIEDACQAHGAAYLSSERNRWMKAGSMGRAAAFSFAGKEPLEPGAGEGGAVTTNDAILAEKIRDAARSWQPE